MSIEQRSDMEEQLINRLKNEEDSFVERKPEGVNSRELRKELVAFANSVDEGNFGVVFLGVANDGEITGVGNSDKLQKRVRNIAENDCYPPIPIQTSVIHYDGKKILGIAIAHSLNKPHFAGPAFVRRGSECVNATVEVYENLINSRSDKCREILKYKYKNLIFTVEALNKKLGETKIIPGNWNAAHECKVEDCNQHFIRLYDISLLQRFSEPMENVQVLWDEKKYRPKLIVKPAR